MGRYRRFRSADESDEEPVGHKFKWFGNNRFICDVLEDMRKCCKSLNFSPLEGLIEEAQVMGNRMESSLGDQRDLIKLNIELSTARKAYKTLEREYKALEKKVAPLRPKVLRKDKS